jgi:quinol monooxygenase YgiN
MIIVAGTLRIPVDKIEALRPTAEATLNAIRKEKGCLVYSYAFDLLDKGLLRIYEEWESLPHLQEHLKQPHMNPWRAKLTEVGASDRNLKRFEAGKGEQL